MVGWRTIADIDSIDAFGLLHGFIGIGDSAGGPFTYVNFGSSAVPLDGGSCHALAASHFVDLYMNYNDCLRDDLNT